MPTNRVTMRQIRETLRLHMQAGLSYNEIGRVLKISKSVAGKYVSLARVAGVDWDLVQALSDEELEARLYRPALPRSSHQRAPDFGMVHQELKRPGVTLMLLWEEYAKGNPLAYKYTSFCVKYAEFARRQQRSMRQIHIAGEKLFVDYAGGTVPIVDPLTGEITQLCEKFCGKSARVFRVRPFLLRLMQGVASFFEPAVNVAERLAFDKVVGGGTALAAPMEESYAAFGLDPAETTRLEDYLKEYYDTILRRLREMEADLDKDAKKKLPF